MQIIEVPSLPARFCLRFEWIALPIGIGLSIGSIPSAPLLFATHGRYFAALAIWCAFGPLFLAVGLWRPVHRRMKIERRDMVIRPISRPV